MKLNTLSAVLAVLILAASTAAAQTGSATIIGQITDEGGLPLPGVGVTLRSPALQVSGMNTVTDQRGEYRLTPLPIGVYTVEYSLPGFQTLRLPDVRLTTGFIAKLDHVMKIGQLAETVTVSGQTPLVDVTQASTATTLETEALELIPSGTNGIVGFLAHVPGAQSNIEVGGSAVTDTNLFTANGQGGEMWSLLEGVFAAASQTSASGTHYNFNAIEEARVQTSANGADTPKRGMSVNLITKSGGKPFTAPPSIPSRTTTSRATTSRRRAASAGRRLGAEADHAQGRRRPAGRQAHSGQSVVLRGPPLSAGHQGNSVRRASGRVDHPQAAAPVLPGLQAFGPDQSDQQGHRLLASVRRSRTAIGQPVRAGTRDGTEQRLGRDVEGRMADDHRSVHHACRFSMAGSSTSISTPASHRAYREVERHRDADGRRRRRVRRPLQHERPDPRRAVLSWYKPNLLAGNHGFTFGIDFLDGGNGATNPGTPQRRLSSRVQQQCALPDRDLQHAERARAANPLLRRIRAGFVDDQPAPDPEPRPPRPARSWMGSGAVPETRHVRPGVPDELQRRSPAEHLQFRHAARPRRLRRDWATAVRSSRAAGAPSCISVRLAPRSTTSTRTASGR